jgi:alanyl-tRNA synthetase
MTERLYFTDTYLRRFEARVLDRRTVGGQHAVLLDRSAFYPEGGGQPADHGTLSGVGVIDVQSEGDDIWHTLDGSIAEDAVTGEIDWNRRFDHMQQHHGQHLLSAAFEQLFQLPTLAFHLGVDYASIDLPGTVTEEQSGEAEWLTNEVIWDDRPIQTRLLAGAELAAVPLRKPPTVDGPVRVVSVPDFDHSACGGTHPRSTGAVGLLHIRRRERRGSETRIGFLCGARALRDLRSKTRIVGGLAADLTVGPDELEEAVRRIRDRETESRKRLSEAIGRLLAYEAEALIAGAERHHGTPLVRIDRGDLSTDDARTLARELVTRGAHVILGVRGDKTQVLVARAPDSTVDCARILKQVLTELGGRGGGQPEIAQGGLPDEAALPEALDRLYRKMRGQS